MPGSQKVATNVTKTNFLRPVEEMHEQGEIEDIEEQFEASQDEDLAESNVEQPLSSDELMDKINERDQAIEGLAIKEFA